MKLTPYQLSIFNDNAYLFAEQAEIALKKLLEKKHLYQSVEVGSLTFLNFPGDVPNWDFDQWPPERSYHPDDPQFDTELDYTEDAIRAMRWTIMTTPHSPGWFISVKNQTFVDVSLPIHPPPVQLYCKVCKRKTAYNFLLGYDVFEEAPVTFYWNKNESEQVFVLVYQCQTCRSQPEVFLIQRHRSTIDQFTPARLTLTGRMPLETPIIPRNLPKKERKHFRNAVIAFDSGQALAAKFLLRIFLEQYVRGVATNPEVRSIESLFDEYNATLPDDFKQRFPSLKSIYDQLSEDIHAADETPEIFETAKQKIVEHFDAKRVFKISN